MADPTISPQFVGRYPGAAIPVPPPVAPSQFVSRLPTGAPGTTSGAVPTFQPVQIAAPAAAPAPGVVTPASINAIGIGGVPIQVPAPTAAPAPSLQAMSAVGRMDPYNAPAATNIAATAAQPPVYDANGNEQVNRPPLVNGEIPGTGGGAGMPTDAVPDTNAAAPAGGQPDDGIFRPAQTLPGSQYRIGGPASPGGAGSTTAAAITGGSLVDPSGPIATGYDQQVAYGRQMMQMLNDMAGPGGALGFHARIAALAQAVGQNNFGQVQGQGVDALNNSIAGVSSTGINADALNYAQEQANAREAANIAGAQQRELLHPVPTGQGIDFSSGYGVPTTTYSQAKIAPGGAVTFSPVGPEADRQARRPVPVEGATTKDKYGNVGVYHNGQWVPQTSK